MWTGLPPKSGDVDNNAYDAEAVIVYREALTCAECDDVDPYVRGAPVRFDTNGRASVAAARDWSFRPLTADYLLPGVFAGAEAGVF